MNTEPDHNAPQAPPRANPAIGPLAVAAVCGIAAIVAGSLGSGELPTGASVATDDNLCHRVDDAYLSGTLYGGIERRIEWRGADMHCTGGTRPGGAGIRLVFAAPERTGGERLVFVIGISGTLDELMQTERPANVTVIDELSGRFFSSRGRDRCWTTVTSVDSDSGREDIRIGGDVYCSGSLPSLSDGGSISLRNFRYSGRLRPDAS